MQQRLKHPGNAAAAAQAMAPADATASNAGAVDHRQAGGRKQQEEMLTFIGQRLSAMREAQKREVAQTSHFNQRTWWDEVADTHKQRLKGLTRPVPTRWHEPAELYREAALAISRGDALRGASLMRSAAEAEQRAFADLTSLVKADDLLPEKANPWQARVLAAPSPAIDVPASIDALFREITQELRAVDDPPVREEERKEDEEEDEDDEEEDDEGGG